MDVLKPRHDDLKDSEGSMKFCERVKSLITAMNTRTYNNRLQPGNDMYKVIIEFNYIDLLIFKDS